MSTGLYTLLSIQSKLVKHKQKQEKKKKKKKKKMTRSIDNLTGNFKSSYE